MQLKYTELPIPAAKLRPLSGSTLAICHLLGNSALTKTESFKSVLRTSNKGACIWAQYDIPVSLRRAHVRLLFSASRQASLVECFVVDFGIIVAKEIEE